MLDNWAWLVLIFIVYKIYKKKYAQNIGIMFLLKIIYFKKLQVKSIEHAQ